MSTPQERGLNNLPDTIVGSSCTLWSPTSDLCCFKIFLDDGGSDLVLKFSKSVGVGLVTGGVNLQYGTHTCTVIQAEKRRV